MVIDTCDAPDQKTGDGLSILVRPNRSLSLRGMALLFVGLAVIALIIGAGFLWAGAWLVLPFAGLELATVGVVLYRLTRHADDYDQIVISDDRVTVTRYRDGRERHDYFQRYWVKVVLEQGRGWYPSRLTVGSHGRSVTIAADVSEEERQHVLARLNEALHQSDDRMRAERAQPDS